MLNFIYPLGRVKDVQIPVKIFLVAMFLKDFFLFPDEICT